VNVRLDMAKRVNPMILISWENGERSRIWVPTVSVFERNPTGPRGSLYEHNMARPISVGIISAFLWIAMVSGLLVGAALLFPGTYLDRMWVYNQPAHTAFQAFGKATGSGFLLLGVVVGIAAAGLSSGRRWAWRLAIVIFALNGIGDLVSLLVTRDLLRSGSGFVIAIGFLVVLLRRNARLSFS
jgi:hypothetical protein